MLLRVKYMLIVTGRFLMPTDDTRIALSRSAGYPPRSVYTPSLPRRSASRRRRWKPATR